MFWSKSFWSTFFTFVIIVFLANIIWKGLILVVISGSMEPTFRRGDVIFLTNTSEPIRVSDIIVFKIEGRDIPIVHRVVKLNKNGNGTIRFLTKGDNNPVDDRVLYPPGQLWLTPRDVVGKVQGHIPYAGMFTIFFDGYPKLKYALLACLGCYIILEFLQKIGMVRSNS